ncbi:MAG: response regulator [Chloroflexi bacterium]|nr:response regulator [Chloroflexota bacterium]
MKTERILVVDDEPEVAEVLKLMLRRFGHRVRIVSNGREALDAFSSEDYDLVSTDLCMPDLSGREVAKAVKGAKAEVPVLLITGWALQLDPSDMDFDGMIAKPFSKETLSQHVTGVLAGKEEV